MKHLKKDSTEHILTEIEIPLAYVLSDMEYTGVNVDKNYLLRMGEEVSLNLKQKEEEIYKLNIMKNIV